MTAKQACELYNEGSSNIASVVYEQEREGAKSEVIVPTPLGSHLM